MTEPELKLLGKEAHPDSPMNQKIFMEGHQLCQKRNDAKPDHLIDELINSLGDTDNTYEISSMNGEFWITHKDVGSGEPLRLRR